MSPGFRRLTDHQWEVIKPFLKNNAPKKLSLRDVVDSIRWLNRTGAQWRNLDSSFPKWQSVYYYHSKWSKDGVSILIMSELSAMERAECDRESTPSLVAVDSQSVKASPCVSEDRGIDGGKKVNGRKRHIAVDTLGLPWAV